MKRSGISIREFARRDGCSDTLVRRALKSGQLAALPDGSVDPSLIGSAWRPSNSEGRANTRPVRSVRERGFATEAPPLSVVTPRDDETLEEAAERLTPSLLSQFESKADAERVKETYLALLRKLEFDEKSGEVVRVSEVSRIVGAEYAKVRSKLMEIPATIAPAVVLMDSPEAVRDRIEREIALILEELAYDGSGADT